MFLFGTQLALGVQRFERSRQTPSGLGWFDDVIHQPPAGRNVGIGKRLAILVDQFLARGLPYPRRRRSPCRKTISAAPSAPITAISAVGHATTRSAPSSLQHMAMYAPP